MSKRPLVIDGGVTKELPAGVPLTVAPAVASTDALSRGQLLDGSFSPVVNALTAKGKLTQTTGAGVNNSTPLTQYADLFSDAIVSGLTTATITTLTGTLAAGVAYVFGQRVVYAGGTYTVAASSTSYLDLSNTGVVTVTTSTTVTANSLRLWSVTSNASAITAVAQIAKSGIVANTPIISPIFTGTPTSPTAAAGTNTTQIATTAFVEAATAPLQLLADIKTVDGTGSGLDADLLDGLNSTQFLRGDTVTNISAGSLELGSVSGAHATYIDFHTGATVIDYDSRIIATGGNGTVGGGIINVMCATFIAGDTSALPGVATNNLKATNSATLAGTTAGTVVSTMPDRGVAKKFVAYANGYSNNTTTSQTITFPLAFSNPPIITNNTSGLSLSVSTTTLTINAPNNATSYSGVIIVEGI